MGGSSSTQNTNSTTTGSGTSRSQVQIPAWLENAARQNMARADAIAQIGYVPYYGPEVAALTPMQVQAMQGTNAASSAFGLGSVDPMAGMPQAETFAGGVQGYSSMPMFEQALAQLRAERPGQYNALMAPFINPQTGATPAAPFGSMPAGLRGDDEGRSGGGGSVPAATTPSRSKYFMDMAPQFKQAPSWYVNGVAQSGAYSPEAVTALSAPRQWYEPQGSFSGNNNGMALNGSGSLGGLLSTAGSYAPGGVNSPFGGGAIDRAAASLSSPQGNPTAADRPKANPRR